MARFSRIALLVSALLMLATSIAGASSSICQSVPGYGPTGAEMIINNVQNTACCPENLGCTGASIDGNKCSCAGCTAQCKVISVNLADGTVISSGASTLWTVSGVGIIAVTIAGFVAFA